MNKHKSIGSSEIVLIGAGGHSRSTLGIIKSQGIFKTVGFLDDTKSEGDTFYKDIKFLGKVSDLELVIKKFRTFAIGIGTPLTFRKKIYSTLKANEVDLPELVHSWSMLDSDVIISSGVQIHSGAIVRYGARLGSNTIINSGAVVDHDSTIGNHSSISPNATICGGVEIGDCTFVGAAATVLPRVKVGSNCIIAAGAVLTQNVPDGKMAIGHPASICEINEKSKLHLLGEHL